MRSPLRADGPGRDRPAAFANAALNVAARGDRALRWRGARDALWAAVEPHVAEGAAVLVVGAGNCHDLPLTRLLRRAGRVDLADVHPAACRAALRRERRGDRARGRALAVDVADGLADAVVAAAARGTRLGPSLAERAARVAAAPLGEGPYDLVIGDLVYTQLLFPGLEDADVRDPLLEDVLAEDGPVVTRAVVARLHAAAPRGVVVHVHDAISWWREQPQPFTVAAAEHAIARGPDAVLALVARGDGPLGCDPRVALAALGRSPRATAAWRWPFAPDVDYLVVATVVA